MRETDYRFSTFLSWCRTLESSCVALYGTGANARRIIEQADRGFEVCTLIDDKFAGDALSGMPAVRLAEAIDLGIDTIIVAAETKSAVAVAKRLYEPCLKAGVRVFDMLGDNMLELGQRVDNVISQSLSGQFKVLESAQTLCINLEMLADVSSLRTVAECRKEDGGLERCIHHVAEYALAQGKRVVFYTTDPVLDRNWALQVLRSMGLEESGELLIAGEYGLWPESGFFRRIYDPDSDESVVHVGSNVLRDCIIPMSYGKNSVIAGTIYDGDSYKLARRFDHMRFHGAWCDGPVLPGEGGAEARLRQAVSAVLSRPSALADEQASRTASVIAPLVIGFAIWLASQLRLRSGEFDEVLFASRDGWIVKQTYDAYREVDPGDLPPSRYLRISRKAVLAASRESSRFTPERKAALEYFDACGLKLGGSYAFVEFVGAGTCQKALEHFSPFRIRGYYFGSRFILHSGCSFDADYYMDDGDTSFLARYLCFETLFTTDEPSLEGYAEGGVPVFAEERRGEEELFLLRRVHEHVFEIVREYFCNYFEPGDKIGHGFANALTPALDICDISIMKLYDDLAGGFIEVQPGDANTRAEDSASCATTTVLPALSPDDAAQQGQATDGEPNAV